MCAMSWVLVMHWLHVVSAVTWGSGVAAMALIVWPLLLARPATESRALWGVLEQRLGPVFGPLGLTTWISGALRGTWLGPLQSWDALFGTGYGRWFLTALALLVGFMIFGGAVGKRVSVRVWDGDRYHPGARRFVHGTSAVTLAFIAAILLCMVRMRFGG
jgi:putative copper export protein